MNAKERIKELLEASEDGTITAAQVTEMRQLCTAYDIRREYEHLQQSGIGLAVDSNLWRESILPALAVFTYQVLLMA